MSRFNTGNPLGSGDPRDLDDNAKNMDLAVNSEDSQWIDRFGRPRLPLMEQERQFVAAQERHEDEFQSAQESRSDRFNDFIASSGYQFVGDYGPGIEITEYNQLIRDSNGEFWRVSGQVELPYVTTGAGIPEDDALVPAGDAVLRQDLANPDIGAAMVARGVVAVDSIADLLALPEGQRKEGLRYLVKGYHAGSNVGGGEFYWNADRSKADHDGGSVIDPDLASLLLAGALYEYLSAAGVGTGVFERVGPYTDVHQYGFTTSTDLGRFADSLKVSELRFSEKRDGPVSLGYPVEKAHVTFIIDGKLVVELKSTLDAPAFTAENGTVAIRGHLEVNGSNTTAGFLDATGCVFDIDALTLTDFNCQTAYVEHPILAHTCTGRIDSLSLLGGTVGVSCDGVRVISSHDLHIDRFYSEDYAFKPLSFIGSEASPDSTANQNITVGTAIVNSIRGDGLYFSAIGGITVGHYQFRGDAGGYNGIKFSRGASNIVIKYANLHCTGDTHTCVRVQGGSNIRILDGDFFYNAKLDETLNGTMCPILIEHHPENSLGVPVRTRDIYIKGRVFCGKEYAGVRLGNAEGVPVENVTLELDTMKSNGELGYFSFQLSGSDSWYSNIVLKNSTLAFKNNATAEAASALKVSFGLRFVVQILDSTIAVAAPDSGASPIQAPLRMLNSCLYSTGSAPVLNLNSGEVRLNTMMGCYYYGVEYTGNPVNGLTYTSAADLSDLLQPDLTPA